MYGIKGIDHIAQPGLLKRVIAGSYPSGPSSADPPKIWQLIEDGEIEAYNLPSGVLLPDAPRAAPPGSPASSPRSAGHLHRPAPTRRPDERRARPHDIVRVDRPRRPEWLFFPAIPPDVAIIRATTADEYGQPDLRGRGLPLGALDQAYAAHNNGGIVIAQVKRLAAGRHLHPQHVRVPGILVDALVVAPDQLQTTQTRYDPAITGELRRPARCLELAPWSPGEGHRPPRRAGAPRRRDRQPRLRHLGPRPARPRRGGPRRTGHLGHRAGRRRRRAAARLRLRLSPRTPTRIMPSTDQFTLLQGGGFRPRDAVVPRDRRSTATSTSTTCPHAATSPPASAASPTSPPRAPEIVFIGSFTAGRRDIAVEDGRLVIRSRRRASPSSSSKCPPADLLRAAARSSRAEGHLRHRTLRARAAPRRPHRHRDRPRHRPRRDVLDRAEFPLQVSEQLKIMDARLFAPERIGLTLNPTPPHARIAGLTDGTGAHPGGTAAVQQSHP